MAASVTLETLRNRADELSDICQEERVKLNKILEEVRWPHASVYQPWLDAKKDAEEAQAEFEQKCRDTFSALESRKLG
ncbi:hypothetical protein [Pseudomonas sp. BN102]|uniref:hypothetical protein n=1 Tax=Pseudomonas sp. BN102 TaxID=2567886 RepID=UPI002456D4C0|nr:hypothetical protein [Pseudomonas sp. BN102]MDH4611356.1 hypothetical protein [Pseudomonas sp. BN102]